MTTVCITQTFESLPQYKDVDDNDNYSDCQSVVSNASTVKLSNRRSTTAQQRQMKMANNMNDQLEKALTWLLFMTDDEANRILRQIKDNKLTAQKRRNSHIEALLSYLQHGTISYLHYRLYLGRNPVVPAQEVNAVSSSDLNDYTSSVPDHNENTETQIAGGSDIETTISGLTSSSTSKESMKVNIHQFQAADNKYTQLRIVTGWLSSKKAEEDTKVILGLDLAIKLTDKDYKDCKAFTGVDMKTCNLDDLYFMHRSARMTKEKMAQKVNVAVMSGFDEDGLNNSSLEPSLPNAGFQHGGDNIFEHVSNFTTQPLLNDHSHQPFASVVESGNNDGAETLAAVSTKVHVGQTDSTKRDDMSSL